MCETLKLTTFLYVVVTAVHYDPVEPHKPAGIAFYVWCRRRDTTGVQPFTGDSVNGTVKASPIGNSDNAR